MTSQPRPALWGGGDVPLGGPWARNTGVRQASEEVSAETSRGTEVRLKRNVKSHPGQPVPGTWELQSHPHPTRRTTVTGAREDAALPRAAEEPPPRRGTLAQSPAAAVRPRNEASGPGTVRAGETPLTEPARGVCPAPPAPPPAPLPRRPRVQGRRAAERSPSPAPRASCCSGIHFGACKRFPLSPLPRASVSGLSLSFSRKTLL